MQVSPGAYTLQLDIVKPGTTTQKVLRGQVLVEQLAYTSVSASSSIAGALAFNPPLAQAGANTPVTLDVLVANSGNVPLTGTPLTLSILSPDGSSVVYTAPVTNLSSLPVGQFVYISFGQWVPTQNGNLKVNITAGAGVAGQIGGSLYVGDRPQGTFVVTPTMVYTGTQTVAATVSVAGVNTPIDVPNSLADQIRAAVQSGSAYIGAKEKSTQEENAPNGYCLRCHVQSQTYYGLASLQNQNVGTNTAATQFVYNSVASGQQDEGSFDTSYSANGAQGPNGYRESQTILGLWALTQNPDKVGGFAEEYKAAQFMLTQATISGGSMYWNPDYSSNINLNPQDFNGRYAWFQTQDSHAMMAVKGFVDLLLTAQNNNVTNLPDYSMSATTSLGNTTASLKVGPDGALYTVIPNSGSVVRFDPVAASKTTVASGLPGNCTSVLPVSASEFYVACPGQLYHVLQGSSPAVAGAIGQLAQGTQDVRFPLTAGADIVVGPDGNFYISDPNNNQILRGPPGGPFTTYVSGAPFNSPVGLAFGSDGALYVANFVGFNILRVAPDQTVTVFADGLIHPPLWITGQPNGSFYVQHAYDPQASTQQLQQYGLLSINPQGYARHMLMESGLNGLAMSGGNLYSVDLSGNLGQVVISTLDTSKLATLASSVPQIANYLLSRNNSDPNEPDNMVQAERMIGMGEIARYVSDPQLLASLQNAMGTINTLLRSRQNADGGWGWEPPGNGLPTGSDAMVTALVGTALDYLSPPTSDPVVQNAVTYLLNNQMLNQNNAHGCGTFESGAWCSADAIMHTNFSATGLVMAYLPRVLDRLAGLNVSLHLNFPSSITLSNPNIPAASSLTAGDGSSAYIWNLYGVTAQSTPVTFNLTLANMQPNESRLAASAATLISTNSFNGSQVRVDLSIPVIKASDEMALTQVATDSGSYPANAPVQITGTVQNSAPAAQSGTVVFTIKAADGSVVAVLPAVPFSNLASNASTPVNTTWNTGTALAGTYPVVGDLYDGSGTFVNEQAASLTIKTTATGGTGGGPNTEVTLRVTTDKPVYSTTDQVNIGDLVKNISVNGLVASASLKLTLTDPNNAAVYSVTVPLGQLTPGYLRQLSNLYGLKASPTGNYMVTGTVNDGTGTVLATGSAAFKVIEDQALTITGTESVSQPSVYQGDPLTCNDAVINRGTLAANNLPVQQLIINLDTGTIDTQANTTATLAAGATQTYVRNFTTGSLAIGNHACVIQAQVDGAYKTLANAPFVVQQPPVRVTGSLTLGDKGRLLVLMDKPTDHGPPLCNTGLADVALEADLDQNLSPEAVVEVKVLNVLGLVVDTETTSLKSFTGEVNLNIGKSGIDLVIPSFTTNSLVVKLLGTGAGNLLSGTYRVVAKITDQTNLRYLTLDSGLISCTCNVLGAVGSLLNNTFTVIGLNDSTSNAGTGIGDGADSTSIAQQESVLHSLLSQDGWSYDLVLSKDDFAKKLRSGGYQDYALLSEYQVLDPQVQEELREHAYNGEGLLVAGRHDVRTRILDNPLGIEYRGTQLQPLDVQMQTGNAYGLTGQESFTQNSQVQRFVLEGATVDGTVLSGIPTAQTSLVAHNAYGNGKSALGGYDLLAEASAEKAPNLFSGMIRKPLLYVNPSQAIPLAGRVVPLHLNITNTGIANTTQATISTSLNGYVVAASAGTVANSKLVWTTPLAVGQTLGVDLWVQVSSDGSPVTVTATLIASTPTFTAKPVVLTQVLSPLVRPSLAKAIADLTTYVANQPPPGLLGAILDPILGIKTPVAAALDELKQAQSSLNSGNAGAALSDMTEAASYLINDGSASLKPIRLEVDEAIYQTEKLI